LEGEPQDHTVTQSTDSPASITAKRVTRLFPEASIDCHIHTYPYTAMLQSHSARQALQCLPRARRNLSSTSRVAALSPYNRGTTATQAQTTTKRNVSAKAALQSEAATASSATATRTVPSPAFNREDSKLRDAQPLQPYRQPELDHSFVGKNGGEIFHEMMLRQGVKHVCK
jgi:acetolactate synthase-1/2/3 large subunit